MIYFDHNAATPIAPEVREAMLPFLNDEWGNASSGYRFGSKNKGVIEAARGQVARLLGANAREIIFTSCATESNDTAIHAALKANPQKRHVITSQVEHSSVLALCQSLKDNGYHITYLGVDRDGLLDVNELRNAINDETALVSPMWANNETGVLFPVQEIGEICRERNVLQLPKITRRKSGNRYRRFRCLPQFQRLMERNRVLECGRISRESR